MKVWYAAVVPCQCAVILVERGRRRHRVNRTFEKPFDLCQLCRIVQLPKVLCLLCQLLALHRRVPLIRDDFRCRVVQVGDEVRQVDICAPRSEAIQSIEMLLQYASRTPPRRDGMRELVPPGISIRAAALRHSRHRGSPFCVVGHGA